ncbi:hypothetical protein PIB30_007596 [Stylosanthes scabra]|uniref:Uncharacterized protein n=1 Tax=Stylosanthes scabra TaxID=79078 RepID=A0ABU6U3I2_9FABA|nr:hypothetical protein [Stylosanthes scabra]
MKKKDKEKEKDKSRQGEKEGHEGSGLKTAAPEGEITADWPAEFSVVRIREIRV